VRIPPYQHYKSSGVEWLGDVPEHWGVKRGRFTMRVNPSAPRLRALKPEDEVSFVPMEAVGEEGGLSLEQTRTIAEVSNGYTEFQDGDVVVAKITPCFENGKTALACGLLNGAAYGTTELHVLRAGNSLNRNFLFYVAVSDTFRKLGESEMYGAGGQKRVPPEFNKNFRMPFPPLVEQQAIAEFLDWETGRVSLLLDKKQELLERLKEKRTALISRSVTRGLPPADARAANLSENVTLKPSGAEWLGDIPAHWEVKQLKWAIMFQRGHDLPSDERADGAVPLVSSAGISAFVSKAAAKGPGIVTGRYGTIGEFYLVDEDYWPLNTTLYSIELRGNHLRFLWYMLQHLAPLFLLNAAKSAVPGVDRNDIHPTTTAVPPLPEQIAIADFLDRETAKIDALMARVEEAVERVREYRTALITAAVTGKIDVRKAVFFEIRGKC
jgi:type I restriction enzyme S subunit